MTKVYAIAGRFLCVQALSPWSARRASNFLSDFRLEPVADSVEKSFYTIRIRSEEPLPVVARGSETFEVAFGHCDILRDGYCLAVDDSVILVGPVEQKSLDVWIGPTRHARQSLSFVNVMGYVLDIALRRSGLYQLHAAGVVYPPSGAGALLVGESGSGKSTLSALLASRGWSYLTDDAILLEQDGQTVRARGIRRFFAASEKTLAACRLSALSNALGAPIKSDPSKRRLEPAIAFPGRSIESSIPKALLFTSITNEAKSTLWNLRPSEAMARLIRSNPWASYDKVTARDHLRLLNRLVNQCRAYSIGAGLDIVNEPSCAEELLAPLLDMSSYRKNTHE